MTTTTNEFTPAWAVIDGVKQQCANTFDCDHIVIEDNGAFTALLYAAYKDPNALVPKFRKAGGRVNEISGGQGNWYHITFTVVKA